MNLLELKDAIRDGFAELTQSVTRAAEPPPDDYVTAPDPTHELETARQMMRMDAAKLFMAALAVNHAEWDVEEVRRRGFALADAYVTEALARATPPTAE